MADAFNLTAQLNLRGPSNIKTVVADIRRQIGTVNADLKFKIDPTTTRNLAQLNSTLRTFNATLNTTQTSATNAARALSSLGRAVNGINIKNLPQQINSSANAVNKLSAASVSNTKALQTASTEMQEFGKQAYLAVRRFAAFTGVTGVIFSVTSAIQKGVEAFIEYDRQFVKLQQVTGESAAGLQNLSKTITNLATGLGVASSDITEVASTLAQAGLSARDTERALKALALSSLAPSFDDMNETVEGSIALMRQFGINAGQLEGALGSVNAVAAKFAVEASDIITAIQRTGGVFATASKGVSEGTDALNEFVAVFTSVRATTRESAETIATGLRTIFTRIQRGSTIEALKEYGVNLTDVEGKFVGAYKAVELLSQGLNKLDPRDLKFSNIVEELGGFRQIGKVIPLIQQFATAQEALKVAQRGQGSLALDAAKAQDSLSNKIVKVKEEFFALFREIGNSDGFQTLIRGALDLSSALIKIADSIKGVLPALGIFAAFKGVSALTQFTSGFVGAAKVRQKSDGGPIRKFATGGLVPGQGNSDTVPAMLTPGEFVIRKKAVQTIGMDKLHKMNKYASGGKVRDLSQIKPSLSKYYDTNKNITDYYSSIDIKRDKLAKTREKYRAEADKVWTAAAIRYKKTKNLELANTIISQATKPINAGKYKAKELDLNNKPPQVLNRIQGALAEKTVSNIGKSSLEKLPNKAGADFKVSPTRFIEVKNKIEPTDDNELKAKALLAYAYTNGNPAYGFRNKLSDTTKQISITLKSTNAEDYNNGGFVSRFAVGGYAKAPLIDDILDNAKGAVLPSKLALERLIQTGYGALDFDRTLKRTTGDAAYARAKTPQEKDAVLSRYFRDRSARLSDAKNSRLTQFGKALQEAIKNKQIDPKNLSIISKSSRVPGLAEHINELFGIPASNMIFTSGGSKEPALEAMRTKGPRANRVFKNLGGFIQRFSGGGGVKDLASMIPSEILAEAKKYGIDVPFTTRDVLRKRKALSSTDSLIKQGLLEQITQARGAAANKAQSDSEIAARRKIAVVGITGDRTEQEILTPGFTDKQSGQSVRGVPATLQSGALPPSLAKRVQALIRGRIENLVRDVGIQIARSAGTNAITDKKAIRNIASKDIEDIAGSIFEKALGAAGGNYDPLSKAIDFPSGLNQQISSLLGVDAGVMTDATYNATSAAAKRKVAKGQFDRGRLEARSRFGRSQFALGGTVQKFASGGEAQTPQLYTRGSLTYSIDDVQNAAQRNGMTLEQLKALLEERQDNDWKDFVIPYYDLEKRFGLTTYKPQDTNLFQKVMAAKIDKEDRIETWKQKQGLATRDYEGSSERQKSFLSARKQRRGFALGGSVDKGLGSKIYDLQKGTGLSDREFNELVYFAKTNDFNEQQFKNYLSSHLQNKQRKQALGTDTEALRRSLLGGATTTSSQMLLAQQLMGAPDAKWNPKYDKARFAVGGSVEDTVPALLTPGEFVINKKAAQRIGTGKLHQLNRADKIQGFNKGGVVQRFAKGGQAVTSFDPASNRATNAASSAAFNPQVSFGAFRSAETGDQKAADMVADAQRKQVNALVKQIRAIDNGVSISDARAAAERRVADAWGGLYKRVKEQEAATISNTKVLGKEIGSFRGAFGGKGPLGAVTSKIADAGEYVGQKGFKGIGKGLLGLANPLNATKNLSSLGRGLSGEKGFYISMGLGALAGQGENIFGKETGRRNSGGMLGASGANAFTAAGLESGTTTLSAGLATASSLAMIPGVGPFAAGLTAAVSVVKAWTSAVEAGKQAAENFANEQRQKGIDDAGDKLVKSLDNFQRSPEGVKEQASVVREAAAVSKLVSEKSLADIQTAQRRKGDSLDFNERLWNQPMSLLPKFLGGTDVVKPKLGADEIRQISAASAKAAEPAADAARKIIETRIQSGSTIAEISKMPDFKTLTETIASANPEFAVARDNIMAMNDSVLAATGTTKEQLIAQRLSVETNKLMNDTGFKAAQKSKEIADAFDEINRKGRDLAASFDRMVDSFNQALGRATYELEQMDQLSEGRSAALQGNASVLSVSSRDSNILRNPRAYSQAERDASIDRASSMFGKDKQMVKDMLGINAKDFALSMTQAVEKDLKGVKIGEGNANLSLTDAASTARKNLVSQLSGVPEDVRQQILDKFDNIVKSTDKDTEGKNPQEKVNELVRRIEGQLGGAAVEGAAQIQQMALAMLDFKNGALNEFINATNKAAEAQLRAQKATFDAEDIIVKGRDNLNAVLGRSGPTPVDIKARQDARIAQLSGGPTDPIQIRENIQNDIKAQSAKQKELQQNTDPGKEKQLVQDISDLSIKIKNGQEALDQLANSTEVASAALNKIQEIQQAMEGQGDFLDKLATATPEEAEKLGQAFMRLQNNLNGGINTIRNSREAQIAYIRTLRETGNPMMAQRASMGVLAQQRAETMSLFKELIPVFQAQNKSPEQIAEMGARLRQGTYTESGMFNNPMLAPLAKQQVDFTRDPMSDPRIAANAALYNQAINKQAEARFQQGALEVYDAGLIMQDATTRFDTAVTRLQTYLENIRSGERPATAAVPKAKGGPIYASSGALVNFEPKGTDTVPAMLTPGEFVVNAKATSQHLPLLKSINNGEDISGYSKGGVVYFADGGAVSARDKARQARKEAYQKQQAARRQAFLGRMRPEVAEGFKTDAEKGFPALPYIELTDNTQKFKTVAKVIGEDDKTYTIKKKEDGAVIKVPKDRLDFNSTSKISHQKNAIGTIFSINRESRERRSLMTIDNRTPEQQERYEELQYKYNKQNPEHAKTREIIRDRAHAASVSKIEHKMRDPDRAASAVAGTREKMGSARQYMQEEIEAVRQANKDGNLGMTDQEIVDRAISNYESGDTLSLYRNPGLDLRYGGWRDLVDWNRDGTVDDPSDIPNEMAIVEGIVSRNQGAASVINDPNGKYSTPSQMVDFAMEGERKAYWKNKMDDRMAKAEKGFEERTGIKYKTEAEIKAAEVDREQKKAQAAKSQKEFETNQQSRFKETDSFIERAKKAQAERLAKPETKSKPYQDPLKDRWDTILKNKEEKQRQDEAKAKERAAARQAEQAAANQAKAAQETKDKQDGLWVNSSNFGIRALGYIGGLGEASGNVAYGAANVVAGAATVATSPVLGYFAGNSPEEVARGEKLAAQTRAMQEKQAAMGVLGPTGTDQQKTLAQAQKSDYRGESSTAAAARVGAKAMIQGAYTAVEAAQAVAGQGPIMTGDKTWLNQGDDKRVQQAGPYGGATRIAQNIGFTASQGVQVATGLGMTTGTSIAGKAGKVLGAVDDVLSNPVGAAAKGAKAIATKAPEVVRSVDNKLIRGITGMTPDGYRASQRTRSGALKSDIRARAANRKAEQWIEDTSKEFFRKPGEQTTRNYGFSGYSPDISTPQSKYPSYTTSLKQMDEMRKPGGANSIDIDENARWKFGDEDLQLGTSINRNSSGMDTIDPLVANASSAKQAATRSKTESVIRQESKPAKASNAVAKDYGRRVFGQRPGEEFIYRGSYGSSIEEGFDLTKMGSTGTVYGAGVYGGFDVGKAGQGKALAKRYGDNYLLQFIKENPDMTAEQIAKNFKGGMYQLKLKNPELFVDANAAFKKTNEAEVINKLLKGAGINLATVPDAATPRQAYAALSRQYKKQLANLPENKLLSAQELDAIAKAKTSEAFAKEGIPGMVAYENKTRYKDTDGSGVVSIFDKDAFEIVSKTKSTAEQVRDLVKNTNQTAKLPIKPKNIKTKTMSNGGIVYASNGALIDAKTQGTDSVPAMLTSGEFVVNRNSAQKHMPVLHAINNGYYNRGGMVQYLNNGGVVGPQYYNRGSINPVEAARQMSANKGANGVNTSGASSGTNSAIQQEPEWLAKLDETVNGIKESLGGMYSNLNNVANQLTNVAQELPREMSITSNVNKNLNVNGIAGEWNKYQGDVLKMAGEQASKTIQDDKVKLAKWSEGAIPVIG